MHNQWVQTTWGGAGSGRRVVQGKRELGDICNTVNNKIKFKNNK